MFFEFTCRSCAFTFANNRLVNIFDPLHSGTTLQIADVLCLCTNIQVTPNDRFPWKICDNCFADLKSSYDLRKRCQNSEDLFKAKLQRIDCKKENTKNENIAKPKNDCAQFAVDSNKDPIRYCILKEEENNKSESEKTLEIKIEYLEDNNQFVEIGDHAEESFENIASTKTISNDVIQHVEDLSSNLKQSENLDIRSHDILFDEDEGDSNVEINEECKKSFDCDICGKSYTAKTSLTNHMRVHTKETPFICKYCGKQFNRSSTLRTHLTLHTGKPYLCNICGKRYSTRGDLAVHSRYHSGEKPYKCSACPAKFCTQSYLTEHFVKHTNEKNQICFECGKIFKRKGSLRLHMFKHIGVNPHPCAFCSKRFVAKYLVQRHMLKIHKVSANHAGEYVSIYDD